MSSSGVRGPAAAPYLPQRGRRVRAEEARGAQKPVEHGGVPGHRCQRVEFDVQQLQDVPDGDVCQQSTLGREDLGGTIAGCGCLPPKTREDRRRTRPAAGRTRRGHGRRPGGARGCRGRLLWPPASPARDERDRR